MKELSIEQKAKAYDEALERASKLRVQNPFDTVSQMMEHVFPELAKSEDERIRKWLIEMVEEVRKANPTNESHNGNCSDAIAWLEKQYKKDEEIILLKDKIESLESSRIAMQECHRLELEKLEKQGEQKPAWSEEDGIWFENLIRHFETGISIEHERVVSWLKSLKNRVQPQPKQEWKQENTGDLTDFENAMMHIGNSFFGQHAGLDPNNTNAIKEQANILLGLLSSNQKWSEEDEVMFRKVIITIDNVRMNTGSSEYYQDICNWLNSLKDRVQLKKEWSEEDETITFALSQLLKDCESENNWNCVYSNDREVFFVDMENWLNSLPHKRK